MYDFIRIQYIMGNITADQVEGFALKFYITYDQAKEIIAMKE